MDYLYETYAQDCQQLMHQPKIREVLPLSIFLILPFLIGSVAVSALPGYNYLVIGLGALCVVVFLMASMREGFWVPTEIKCFAAFWVWGLLGLMVSQYPLAVTDRLRTVFQLMIMAMIISYYARNIRCLNLLFLSVLAGVLIVTSGAVITGQYAAAEVEGEAARLSGFVMNANAFAVLVVYGVGIALYFFRLVLSVILKVIIIGGILIAIQFIIASGSRKGFLALAVLCFTWFLLSYGRELPTRPGLVLLMAVGLCLLGGYALYQLRDSTLLQRFLRLEEVGIEEATGGRLVMIREAVRLTFEYPIFGVGLSCFQLYSTTEKYAHNNYAEVFSTTGIIGGILYHLIYVFIFMRIFRLRKQPLTFEAKNALNILSPMMYTTLFFDLFLVSYYSKITWIILAIVIGYLNTLQRQVAATEPHSDYIDTTINTYQD